MIIMAEFKEFFTLEDGTKVPKIGFGCYNPRGDDFVKIMTDAVDAGYRYFDTASFYETERDVAKGLKASGISRQEVQIASKLWHDEMGYDEALAAFERTQERLDTEYVDFYMIHWPKCSEDDTQWKEKCIGTWKAIEKLKKEGKVKHAGFSNFLPHHIEVITGNCEIKPEIDQLECHIGYSQEAAVAYCKEQGMLVQAWGPLGRGNVNNNAIINAFAEKYGKSFGQISLRFLVQKGIMPIPKAASKAHMLNNLDVFDFELSREDMWMLSCIMQETWQGEHPDFAIPKFESNFDQ